MEIGVTDAVTLLVGMVGICPGRSGKSMVMAMFSGADGDTNVHMALQSDAVVLLSDPSSHCSPSPSSTMRSPQCGGMQFVRQWFGKMSLLSRPASQYSPASIRPFPQKRKSTGGVYCGDTGAGPPSPPNVPAAGAGPSPPKVPPIPIGPPMVPLAMPFTPPISVNGIDENSSEEEDELECSSQRKHDGALEKSRTQSLGGSWLEQKKFPPWPHSSAVHPGTEENDEL